MTDILQGLEDDSRAMQRIAAALEGIVEALAKRNMIEQERLEKEFPPERAKRAAEIIRSDDRAEQFSDKPTDQWLAETEAAAGPSRFAQRLAEAHPQGEAVRPKRKRTVEVPQGYGDHA